MSTGASTMQLQAPRRLQITKIKRRRDQARDVGLSPRKTRMRKLGKEAQLLFKALSLTETKSRRPRKTRKPTNTNQKAKLPILARVIHEKWKRQHGRIQVKCDVPFSHVITAHKKMAIDRSLQAAIHKFQPYRQNAIHPEKIEYFVTLFRRMHPSSEQPFSVNEELIQAYKFSTDDEERRMLRKCFPVVRAMVAEEEGVDFLDETSEEASDAEDREYDYYLETDEHHQLEQYFDEEGNLMDDVNVEWREEEESENPDEEHYYGNDYPSEDTDSAKSCFESTDEDEPILDS